MDKKLYPCKECGRHVPVRSKELCPACRLKQRREQGETPMQDKTHYISPITKKTKENKKQRSKIRDEYYNYHLNKITHSEESKTRILNPTRVNICHLFPKSTHPSVQGNLNNCVYLTADEHTMFDNLLFKHDFNALEQQFNSWGLICKRMRKLLPDVQEKTKLYLKIKEYLGE